MDIRQVVHITLADQAPKIIDGYWHEWVNGEWVNTGVKAEAKDGSNHLIFGFFSDKIQYKLSPAGIPVVKISDSTEGGFSVYELIAPQSTFNHSTGKGTFIPSEWELVENVDFIYMQEAYIERLQSELVTAERIEALNITTGNINITEGAKIAGLRVYSDNITNYPDGPIPLEGRYVFFGKEKFEIKEYAIERDGQIIRDILKKTAFTKDTVRLYRSIRGNSIVFNEDEIYMTPYSFHVKNFKNGNSIEILSDGIYKNGVKVL